MVTLPNNNKSSAKLMNNPAHKDLTCHYCDYKGHIQSNFRKTERIMPQRYPPQIPSSQSNPQPTPRSQQGNIQPDFKKYKGIMPQTHPQAIPSSCQNPTLIIQLKKQYF